MTMFNDGDTDTIWGLRAELEATRDEIRKRDAAIDALTARVAEVVAMISDHADDIAGLQTPGRTPDQHLTAVQEAHFALRQRIGVLERSIATMPPGWSANLDAMERTSTPTVEPPITIAHDGMGPCEACDRDVVAGQEVHVIRDGETEDESDDDIVVHAVCPVEDGDGIPRPAGCTCSQEEGDAPCSVRDPLIAEIAHAPPRDVHAEFLHAEHARETGAGS